MRPIRIGGRRVPCQCCRRKYASAPVFGMTVCGDCLRALFIGVKIGEELEWDRIKTIYELKRKSKEASE